MSKSERGEDQRKERVPLGVIRKKLSVTAIEGYVLRWLTDRDGRIQDAEAAGYEFVAYEETGQIGQHNTTPDSQEQGSKVSKRVGTDDHGAPLIAYLMKIKKEWYDEDQAEKQRKIDETERGVKAMKDVSESVRRKTYGNINIDHR